jgi:hypothetical protein
MTTKEFIDSQIAALNLDKCVIDRQQIDCGDYWVEFADLGGFDADNFRELIISSEITAVECRKGHVIIRFL